MKTIIFLFLFLLLTTTPVLANEGVRGLDLLKLCESPKGSRANNLCAGYVGGMRDMYEVFLLFNTYLERLDMPADYTKHWNGVMKGCTNQGGITTGQIIKVLIKWINENPEKQHKRIVMQFPSIMNIVFPCKQTEQ